MGYGRILWPTIENALSLFGIGHPSALYRSTHPQAAAPAPVSNNPLIDMVSTRPEPVVPAEPLYAGVQKSQDWVSLASTPTPLAAAAPVSDYAPTMVFLYSYYNPKLGGINCAEWDDAAQDCRSRLANGEDYHINFGVAVACIPDIALGSVIEVIYPENLAGEWICKDRGGAIVGNYIDFLDVAQRYAWSGVVVARVHPPAVPVEAVNAGSH